MRFSGYAVSMTTKKNRRPQTPKSRNLPMAKGMLELRQGSRTTPVPSGKKYTRKPKHKEW
jgi:hypothetical protein